MTELVLAFKDEKEVKVILQSHVADLWLNDKKTKQALAKFGEIKND